MEPPDVKRKGKNLYMPWHLSPPLPSFNLSHISSSPSAVGREGAPVYVCVLLTCWGCVWLWFYLDCYVLMHCVCIEGCVSVFLIMKPYGLSVSLQAASTGSCDAGKTYQDETWGAYSCLLPLWYSFLSFLHLTFLLSFYLFPAPSFSWCLPTSSLSSSCLLHPFFSLFMLHSSY